MPKHYSETQVAEALAALEQNGGNVKRTAIQLAIPRATITMWRDKAELTLPVTKLRDYVELWGQAQDIAVARLVELLPVSDDLKAVAYAAGIAADKHLNYRDGRAGSGPTVNVDARSVQIVYQDQRDAVEVPDDGG